MVLNRKIVKEIEYHFYNYEKEKREIDQIATETAEAFAYDFNLAGVNSSGTSDPTAHRVELIEKKCKDIKRWIKVVEDTFDHFKNDMKKEFAQRLYLKKQTPLCIQENLYISERTFYAWKADIVNYAALKAGESGILVF